MKYILILIIMLTTTNLSLACDPAGSQVIPGESKEESLAREKIANEMALNYLHNKVREDSNYADLISDLVIIAKIEKVTFKKPFMVNFKSIFIKEYSLRHEYIESIELQVNPSISSGNSNVGKTTIKLKIDNTNSCGATYVAEFKDEQGNSQKKDLRYGDYSVGAENVFFLQKGQLVFSVEKSVFIDSKVKLKIHEGITK